MSFTILGSGSAGNCSLLELHEHGCDGSPRRLLIDAGLTPRQTRLRLATLGCQIEDISDVLITHFDTDHYRPTWSRPIEQSGITLWVHRRHRSRALAAGVPVAQMRMYEEVFDVGSACVQPHVFAHDQLGCVGFIIAHGGARLGWATDVGRVSATMVDAFDDLDAIACESNYDPSMQRASGRPKRLIDRIVGGRGHLSNQQAFDFVVDIARRCPLQHVALLHLSRQCNDPAIIESLYAQHAPAMLDRLTVTSQFDPSPKLRVMPRSELEVELISSSPRAGAQMGLF